MVYPDIENRSPFAFFPLFGADEEGRPLVAPLVKATLAIEPDGRLAMAEEQLPIDLEGSYHGAPGSSSVRMEPETAFSKPGGDAVLLGHAHAPSVRAVSVDVEFAVGPLVRRMRVVGDRVWQRRIAGIQASVPRPFEKIPLTYERAYGGWDRTAKDPRWHSCDPRNPVGVGFRTARAEFVEGAPLPNIEDPRAALASYQGKSAPTGVGFISPDWEPRRSLAGTFDRAWMESRHPLLPKDFRREFFSSASPGLSSSRPWRGDEQVRVTGASPQRTVALQLPGLEPPVCRFVLRDRSDVAARTSLDTLIVDLDANRVVLIWRTHLILQNGPLDLRALELSVERGALGSQQPRVGAKVVPLRAHSGA